MTNIVHKLSTSQVDSLMRQTQFQTSQLPQGMKAKTKYNHTVISIYNSNKVMFQGNDAQLTRDQLLPSLSEETHSKSSSTKEKPSYDRYTCIGSDEAGSGDYFGPLTVCAAFVTPEHINILKELGVDDSKKLDDNKITKLAEQIITFLPHSILVLHNEKYNQQQRRGWSQVKMKAVLHNQAIKNVVNKIDAEALDYIVIDQFAQRGVYQKYALTDLPYPDKTHFETKGESKSLAIAAASIISRYAFIKHMAHLSQPFSSDLPKGASKKVDLFAAKIIDQYGLAYLDQISKQHFANRAKAITLVDQRRNSK